MSQLYHLSCSALLSRPCHMNRMCLLWTRLNDGFSFRAIFGQKFSFYIYGKRVALGWFKLSLMEETIIQGFDFWKVTVYRRTNESKNDAHVSLEQILENMFALRNPETFCSISSSRRTGKTWFESMEDVGTLARCIFRLRPAKKLLWTRMGLD